MEFLRGRRIASAQRPLAAKNQVADRAIVVLLGVCIVLLIAVVFGVAAALSRAFPTKERQNYKPAPAQQAFVTGVPA